MTDRPAGSLCAPCWAHVSSVSRRGPRCFLRRRNKKKIIAEATARSPKQLPTAIPAIVPELNGGFGCDVSGDVTLDNAVDDECCSVAGETDGEEAGVVINACVIVIVSALDVEI